MSDFKQKVLGSEQNPRPRGPHRRDNCLSVQPSLRLDSSRDLTSPEVLCLNLTIGRAEQLCFQGMPSQWLKQMLPQAIPSLTRLPDSFHSHLVPSPDPFSSGHFLCAHLSVCDC